eukprot:4691120-Pyramimonas_sp.AAC.1
MTGAIVQQSRDISRGTRNVVGVLWWGSFAPRGNFSGPLGRGLRFRLAPSGFSWDFLMGHQASLRLRMHPWGPPPESPMNGLRKP